VTRQKKIEEELRRSQRMDELGPAGRRRGPRFQQHPDRHPGLQRRHRLKAAPDDQNRPFVEEINKAAGRASKLTQTLLSFARKRDLKLEPVDLNAIVQDLGPFLKRIVPQTIQLRLSSNRATSGSWPTAARSSRSS
jgi:signal transduction histidine kinase